MKLKTTKKNKNINAFTLVELIVVVMIIGILSAIAIPIFSSLTEKTRQREASTLINSYLSAAKAYYAESGSPSKNAGDLSNYVDVFESFHYCKTHSGWSCAPSPICWKLDCWGCFYFSTWITPKFVFVCIT